MIDAHSSASNYIFSKQNQENKHVIFSLGLSALALGQALQNENGVLNFRSLFCLTIAIFLLGYALVNYKKPMKNFITEAWFPIIIIGLIWQIYQLVTTIPGIYLLPSAISTLWIFKCGVIIAGGTAVLSLIPVKWLSQSWQSILVVVTLFIFFLLGIWMIRSSPNPFIDVFFIQQASSKALLHGQNPYTVIIPNIYDNIKLYGKDLLNADGTLNFSNPYPPLSIYFATLGYLIGGDVRYAYLLAIIISIGIIAFLHHGREARLAAFILLFTPRVFFVLEQSWTEPLVLLCFALIIFCAVHRPRWIPFMLGLFFASKQYLLFLIPLSLLIFPIPLNSSWYKHLKPFIWIVLVMFVVSAPLAFWNLPAFIWNVGGIMWHYIFRPDSLSYLALYSAIFNHPPPQYVILSLIALTLSFLIIWRFASRDITGLTLSIAWGLIIFFAFNKQAFCNYYFLVISLICCTLACLTYQAQKQTL